MRIFVAVEVPELIRSRISALQKQLEEEGVRGIRWVDAGGIHLTLRFCGEIPREAVERLKGSLSPGAPLAPFEVRVGGLGTFPARGAPRVLWLGVDGAERLRTLVSWIDGRVTAAGIPPEPRPFHPHLTLGRFRPGGRLPGRFPARTPSPDLGAHGVERFILFQSLLGPGGPRYEPLEVYPLRAEAPAGSGQ